MRFDPGKAWPHPVLRPPNVGDDYPEAEFQVEIEVQRIEGSTAVEVDAAFELSDTSLLRLVDIDCASYVLLIKAAKTHFRRLLESKKPHLKESFRSGELSGRVEFTPFLVCTSELSDFRSDGWHPVFAGRTFNVPPGAVLAEDGPKDYWVDTANERPLGSIFGHKHRPDMPDGAWDLELAEDRIWIVMSPGDSARYKEAREHSSDRPEGHYLMNGLYLPALVAVLGQVDQDADEYRESYRWFASLEERLEAVHCRPLGSDGPSRLLDAQKVLDSPFPKMPLFSESEQGGS